MISQPEIAVLYGRNTSDLNEVSLHTEALLERSNRCTLSHTHHMCVVWKVFEGGVYSLRVSEIVSVGRIQGNMASTLLLSLALGA